MSTSRSQSKSSKSSSTHVTHTPAAHAEASAQRIVDGTATATPTPAAGSLTFVTLPPANANIPTPPAGFVATNATDYRGIFPRKVEVAVLANAVTEVQRFTEFDQLFSKSVAPASSVAQIFDAAEKWSTMRNASTAWDLFCRTQEGLSWKAARVLITKLKPAYAVAVAGDSAIATQNPSLNALLGAASDSAKRGIATRAANKQAKAEGKPPTHGKANKKAAKLAAEVAAAAAKATPAPVAAVATATASPTAAPVVAPTATVAPAGVAVNPALDGAGH